MKYLILLKAESLASFGVAGRRKDRRAPGPADLSSLVRYLIITTKTQLLIVAALTMFGSVTLAQTGGIVRAVNISARVAVNNQNFLIGGFIVLGNAPKHVIIRALGPSLAVGGLPFVGLLQDPVLELHDSSGSLIASNDDWRSDHEAEIIATTVPPTNDLESAIVTTLQPGQYTAIAHGDTDLDAGVALVELYDLDVVDQSQVVNISSRGNVQLGYAAMIGGFTIRGSAPANVLVRAIGPELVGRGITSALLQDTTLGLYDSNNTLIAFNDDWETDQEAQILFTNVAPTDPRESAMVKTLTPGSYTAIVRGKNNTIGIALLEVFLLQ